MEEFTITVLYPNVSDIVSCTKTFECLKILNT